MSADRVTLAGRDFELVVTRRTGARVYRGDGTYLRIGPGVVQEQELHRTMLGLGYPIAALLGYGEHEGEPYLLEESLGPVTLGERFEAGLDSDGLVPDDEATFFVDVVRRLATAQADVAAGQSTWDVDGFAALVGVEGAVANLPQRGAEIAGAFADSAARLLVLPGALVHVDLHPHNTCVGGVIDLEGSGTGVLGYDVATAIFVQTLCDPEFGTLTAPAWFSPPLIRTYLSMLDETFASVVHGALSSHLPDLLVCRAIAMCARRHPRSEVWRARLQMLERVLASPGELPAGLRPS